MAGEAGLVDDLHGVLFFGVLADAPVDLIPPNTRHTHHKQT